MTWVSLQMISLGSLLIFNDQTSPPPPSSSPPPPPSSSAAAAAGSSSCISQDEFNDRADKFQRRYWDQLSVPKNPLRDTRTCAQAAKEMQGDVKHRSLSPWTYSLKREDDRSPYEIAFAECLCRGCIINQRENLSYNSVPVFVTLMVMRKTLCLSDPNKYEVKKDFIEVPVACTCVVPKYAK